MVRKSLILAALVAIASPLSAQEEEQWIWSMNRPDATGPAGVRGIRTLEAGEIQVQYRWYQNNYAGVWFGQDSLGLSTTLQRYEVAPITLSDVRHTVEVSYGVTGDLTLRAQGEFAVMEREQLRDDGTYYVTSTNALGDVYADLTYNVIRTGPYRLDVNGGAVIPVGKSATYAVSPYSQPNEEPTSYDMRPGAGSFGVYASASADMQNEVGSIGGQFKFLTYLNENSRGYTLGDRYLFNGWAAYNLNQHFAVTAGARWEQWGRIDGSDEFLEMIPMRDPMNDGLFFGGSTVSMPLGLNFIGPMGSPISGHRIALEGVYALHRNYDGPQTGLDWGMTFSYGVPF